METTASSMFRGAASPELDPISIERRLDFEAPMLMATIGGRPVVLARPGQRQAPPGEPFDVTVPVTMSRMQRAIDVERGRDAYQYVPSHLLGTGLGSSVPFARTYGSELGWPSPDPQLEAQLKAESAKACSASSAGYMCPTFYEAWQMTARQADSDRLLWAGVAGVSGLILGGVMVAVFMK